MANNIVLKTFKGGTVSPLDDAIIQQTVIATNGIFKGCNITYARGNVLSVSQGFGMIRGRFFEVYDCEVGVILNSGSGTLQGRLYIHMDLSNEDEPIQLLTETASVLTDLTGDEDVNYNNTSYDLELATFGVTRTGITNLVTSFEKITGASGTGGGVLQRSTVYYAGDQVTCKHAPGWVTLCCTTQGETAAIEPPDYLGIAKVGDTVQDGTCVFTARNPIGELDSLKDRVTDAEAGIANLENDVQELREELQKQAEKENVPVGTIRFMSSSSVGEDWLKCDGSFVNEADYPDLVKVLGKMMPDGEKFTTLSSGEIPSQISNGVIYGGRMWVYSYSARKVYGIDLEGQSPVKAIPVSSTSSFFADFIPPSASKPICLSIVPHDSGKGARLFLSQFIANGTTTLAANAWLAKFLAFGGEFTGTEDSLTLEPPFSTIKREASGSYEYNPQFEPSMRVPYIVSRMSSGVEKYYCAIGYKHLGSGSSSLAALTWSDGSTEAVMEVILNNSSHDSSVFANQRASFDARNRGEIVTVYGSSSRNSNYYYVYSSPSEMFDAYGSVNVSAIKARGASGPLNVVGENKVLSTFDVDRFPWVSISTAAVGCVEPNLAIPSSAKVFTDGAVYLWGKEIFLIFVGTGIIFSRTLEDGSFGYLDTASAIGNISQFGHLSYSQDEQYLYLLGQDTSNKVKLFRLALNTNFDYATDGAWLPRIVGDGLPAYIKAKEIETA